MTIPSTTNGLPVTSIDSSTFTCCTSVSSVTIPSSITNFEAGMFHYCTNLSEITVDPLNSSYMSVGGILFNKRQTVLLHYPAAKTECSFTIPNTITNIENDAFNYCVNLSSVTIPNSVTRIGFSAFGSCTSLTNITMPDSVTKIEAYAFCFCYKLACATIPCTITEIQDSMFVWDASLKNITIPDTVTRIGTEVFHVCSSLTNITLPRSVATMGCEAFASCNNLTEAYFEGNAPRYYSDVFSGDEKVTVYYLSEMAGWEPYHLYWHTAVWPQEYTYAQANGKLTIVSYNGSEANVSIPATVNRKSNRAVESTRANQRWPLWPACEPIWI